MKGGERVVYGDVFRRLRVSGEDELDNRFFTPSVQRDMEGQQPVAVPLHGEPFRQTISNVLDNIEGLSRFQRLGKRDDLLPFVLFCLGEYPLRVMLVNVLPNIFRWWWDGGRGRWGWRFSHPRSGRAANPYCQ